MSVAISTAIGIGVAVGTSAAGMYAANKASSANERAIESQERSNREAGEGQERSNREASEALERSNREALQFEREKEARRQQEWDRMMVAEEARWDADQARLAPYRAASEGALAQLVSLAGLPTYTPTAVEKPDFTRPMPSDWQPGDPTGLDGSSQDVDLDFDRAVVRKPTSSRLTDLLSDPATGGALMEMATTIGGDTARREMADRAGAGQAARVSPAAYRRITEAPGAAAPSMVARGMGRRPSSRVADLARTTDIFRDEEV